MEPAGGLSTAETNRAGRSRIKYPLPAAKKSTRKSCRPFKRWEAQSRSTKVKAIPVELISTICPIISGLVLTTTYTLSSTAIRSSLRRLAAETVSISCFFLVPSGPPTVRGGYWVLMHWCIPTNGYSLELAFIANLVPFRMYLNLISDLIYTSVGGDKICARGNRRTFFAHLPKCKSRLLDSLVPVLRVGTTVTGRGLRCCERRSHPEHGNERLKRHLFAKTTCDCPAMNRKRS